MKKILILFLLVVVSLCTYSQNSARIKPAKQSAFVWGYQDLLGKWIISPQFSKADYFTKDDIAIVGIMDANIKQHPTIGPVMSTNDINKALYPTEMGLIDLNGDILIKYKSDASQKQKDDKYAKALKIVTKRKEVGVYDIVYGRLAQADATIIAQKQKEQARQDSILTAKRLMKMRADSIAAAKRVADSIALVRKRVTDSLRLAKERELTAITSSGVGLSLKKVKVTGHGLLLSKDKTWREYTIRMDDFNRILVTYEGDTRVRGELNVLKVIYKSDWSLLSDDLFHNVEIVKATTEISQGARTKKFGVFSFLFTLNLDDIDKVFTDEATLLTVQNSIYQIERYITSFINHYKGAAYFVEPLFQMHPNDRTGISVGIVEKQGNKKGIEIGSAKRMCAEARRKLDARRAN